MGINEDRIERIVPAAAGASQESQRSWLTLLATDANTVVTGVVTGVATGVATAMAISRIIKPPPPPSEGSNGDPAPG
jgi:hypothetical protein